MLYKLVTFFVKLILLHPGYIYLPQSKMYFNTHEPINLWITKAPIVKVRYDNAGCGSFFNLEK